DMDLESMTVHDMRQFLDSVKNTALTSQGIVESSMSRGVEYQMIKIGKWLERAEKTARILNVVCERTIARAEAQQSEDYYYWLAALRMTNGYDAYLKVNPPKMDPSLVLEFLVSNPAFPRSIRYCLDHMREAIVSLEEGKISHYSWELFAKIDQLTADFDQFN